MANEAYYVSVYSGTGIWGFAYSIGQGTSLVDYYYDTWSGGGGTVLIGAGNNTNKSTLDAVGKTRPNPPAIGAFEP